MEYKNIFKVLLIAIITVGSVYGIRTHLHDREDEEYSESAAYEPYSKKFPPLEWDGTCPKTRSGCPANFQDTPPLLLVSLDGFRPDYLERNLTPTIKKLGDCGTKAPFMHPVFPSKTFPNHFTIVTGLFPVSHGIVDNNMYDSKRNKLFKVGQGEFLKPYWWKADPIWSTARKLGKITASYFWPGSEVETILPDYYRKYSSKVPFESRVEQVLKWLELPVDKRPSFLTLYVNQPDHAAHYHGTNSIEVNNELKRVDKMIERLFSGLQQRGLLDCVNVVIVSDHGMANTDCNRVLKIQDYVNASSLYTLVGPYGRIRPKGKRDSTLIKNLISNLTCRSDHMRVYPKERLPVRYHFGKSDRIEPIFLDIDSGFTVVSKEVKPNDGICTGGAHGYDNLFPDMKALFLAIGPSISSRTVIEPFLNIEIYEMLTELIGIPSNPNNGTRGTLHFALKSPQNISAKVTSYPGIVAQIPREGMEYNLQVFASNCSCQQTRKQVPVKSIAEKNALHLPFGIPNSPDNYTLRLLYNEDYVAAFDLKYRIPMWSAFTLNKEKTVDASEDVCWRGDVRIGFKETPQCSDYIAPKVVKNNIQQRPLYPPNFSEVSSREQATYVTNSIPKSLNHTKILEEPVYQMLTQIVSEEGQLNVVMGPAFDIEATGVSPDIGTIMNIHEQYGPLVVPTHIFVIATWCYKKEADIHLCDSADLRSTSFLLPNEPYQLNCESATSVISKNVASVKDIETLTGLSFFTDVSIYDAIRLKTSMPVRVPSDQQFM